MKKIMILVMAVMFLLPTTAFASSDDVVDGMVHKAVRGAINLVTGIVEFPVQIIKGYDNGFEPVGNNAVLSKTAGTVVGVFRGVVHAVGRTGWGALELFGFWTVNPVNNDGVGIPLDAKYAWEKGEQYSIFSPNLQEGLAPIGRKLIRGIVNGLLGILELPGQTIKGAHDGNVAVGLGKGVWYWFSREVYGLGEIYSCLLPNPEDNLGVAFEETYPWQALIGETNTAVVQTA